MIMLAEVTVKESLINKTSNINHVVKNNIGACVTSPDRIEKDVSL